MPREGKKVRVRKDRERIGQEYIAEVMLNGPRSPKAIALGDQEKTALKREQRLSQPWWRRK